MGTTPLPGSGVPLARLPANAQIFTSRDPRRQGPTTLADLLGDNAAGVTVNAAQGNPYQSDINLRGFTASPVLGTPQGVSVFLDAIRMNEPFARHVNGADPDLGDLEHPGRSGRESGVRAQHARRRDRGLSTKPSG